jgi:hypothetical protein
MLPVNYQNARTASHQDDGQYPRDGHHHEVEVHENS